MSILKYKEYLNIDSSSSIEPNDFLDEKNLFGFFQNSPPEDIVNLYKEIHEPSSHEEYIYIIPFYNSSPEFLKKFLDELLTKTKNELHYLNKTVITNLLNQLYHHLPDTYKNNKEILFKNDIDITYLDEGILKDYLRNIKRKEKVIKNIIEDNGHISIFRGGDLYAIKNFIALVERIENITNIDIFREMKKNKNKEYFDYIGKGYIELFGLMLTLPDLKKHRVFSSEDERRELPSYIGKYFDFIVEKMNKNNIPLKKIISNLPPYRFVSIDDDIINKMIAISSTEKKNYVIPEILKKLKSFGDEGLDKYNEIMKKVIEDEKIKITSQIKDNLMTENKKTKRL